MRSIKTIIKGAANRIKESCTMFGRRVVIALGTFTFAVSEAMAGSKGAAGFTKATQEISSYETPVSNLENIKSLDPLLYSKLTHQKILELSREKMHFNPGQFQL